MGAWFMAGGFGMLLIAALGLATVFVGASALAGAATEGKVRFLRAAPGLLGAVSAFSFGLNLWAVYRVVEAGGDARIGLIGLFEAAQPLTLGGLLAAVGIVLGLFAPGRASSASA